MHAFDILGDPVRRRIVEVLADGELTSGHIATAIADDFGITQSAVSQHLRVLRDSGFVVVRAEGTRRYYSIDVTALRDVERWLGRFARMWDNPLDALATELARGQRDRRRADRQAPTTTDQREDQAP